MLTEVRSLRDRDLAILWQQHPDGNLQSPPGWIHDTDRPISSLRSAKNPQGNTMKRVKRVEDLNICIVGAQGIVGVGAITRTFIASSPAAASPLTAAIGTRRRARPISFQRGFWPNWCAANSKPSWPRGAPT
jgi:hypothetical protein